MNAGPNGERERGEKLAHLGLFKAQHTHTFLFYGGFNSLYHLMTRPNVHTSASLYRDGSFTMHAISRGTVYARVYKNCF
jgi:hypothetical protein